MPQRVNDKVLAAIREKYAPRYEDGSINPDLLWVGGLIDGLTIYCPEIIYAAFQTESARNPATHRRRMKTLLMGTNPGARGVHLPAQNIEMYVTRPGWGVSKSGEPIRVRLIDRENEGPINIEPGELVNSPRLVRNPETGVEEIVPEPVIRVDKRYGLHYLLRGDRVDFLYRDRRGEPQRLVFELRPLSEGSSLLTPERSDDTAVL